MGFKRFSAQLYLRFGLILLVLVAIAWSVVDASFVLLPIAFLLLVVLQIVELLRYVRKTNRDLSRFIFSIQHNDFTASYRDIGLADGFPELAGALNAIADKFRQNRIEKESYLHFLDAIVEHVQIGLIALNEQRTVRLMNQTAVELLGLPNLQKWERFQEKAPTFAQLVEALRPGERKLLQMPSESGVRSLAINLTNINLLGENHRIVTFYDIRSELESRELESYGKLISILTHEIMNSVTPISSLSETVQSLVATEGVVRPVAEFEQDDLQDLAASVQTIRKRSDGLLRFVGEYRKVTRIPEPQLAEMRLDALLNEVNQLLLPEMEKRGIQLEISVSPPPLKAFLDADQITQVLINILTNSMQALEESDNPRIALSAFTQDGIRIIEVADNGPGIPDALRNKVLVPFFTTKENGSGIGLSLSQRIMQQHGGSLQLGSASGGGTRVTLKFRY